MKPRILWTGDYRGQRARIAQIGTMDCVAEVELGGVDNWGYPFDTDTEAYEILSLALIAVYWRSAGYRKGHQP